MDKLFNGGMDVISVTRDNVRRYKSYTTLYFFGKPGFCKGFANDCKEKVTGIKFGVFCKIYFLKGVNKK
jgi:hypothetical protein